MGAVENGSQITFHGLPYTGSISVGTPSASFVDPSQIGNNFDTSGFLNGSVSVASGTTATGPTTGATGGTTAGATGGTTGGSPSASGSGSTPASTTPGSSSTGSSASHTDGGATTGSAGTTQHSAGSPQSAGSAGGTTDTAQSHAPHGGSSDIASLLKSIAAGAEGHGGSLQIADPATLHAGVDAAHTQYTSSTVPTTLADLAALSHHFA